MTAATRTVDMMNFSKRKCATSATFPYKASMRKEVATPVKYLSDDRAKQEFSVCEHRTGSPPAGNSHDNIRTVALNLLTFGRIRLIVKLERALWDDRV